MWAEGCVHGGCGRVAVFGAMLLALCVWFAPADAQAAKAAKPQQTQENRSELVVTGIVVITDDGPVLETADDRIFLLRGVRDTEIDGLELTVTGTAQQIEEGYYTLDVTGYSVVDEDSGQSQVRPQAAEGVWDMNFTRVI